MTVTKNFNNLDTDNTLGGNSPSDYRVSSQKAIKTYIDNKFFYGISDSAATDIEKTVSIPSITELNVGQVIIVQPTITSTVANSTLKLNNFDAYPMRYNGGAITTSTDNQVWSSLFPTTWLFNGEYWVFVAHGFDANTTIINSLCDSGSYIAGIGNYAVTRNSLLLEKPNGTWEKTTDTTKNYTTATNKTANTRGFLLNHIRYYNTSTVVANGALIATNTLQNKASSVNLAYSTNCGSAPGWDIGDYIYLVGSMGADGLFYLDTTQWWSNVLPSTNDGKLYIRIGIASTTTNATASFFDDRPIFYHNGTKICEYKVADNKQDLIPDLATIRSGASAGATALQPNDNISELTNNAGYITSSALNGYATESFVTSLGYITGITSSDVTTALGYTPYNSTNPNGYITASALNGYATKQWVTNQGYTTNVGTVTSVNNTQPDANGNVELTIPSEVTESTVSGWGFIKNSVNNLTNYYTKTEIDNIRKLVEFKKPTTSSPSWYNLYSDGYVEQGGEITVGNTTIGQVTFSKEFENNKYMPILTCITYTAGNIDGLCHITELTTTGMKIFDASGRTYRWECKGYINNV